MQAIRGLNQSLERIILGSRLKKINKHNYLKKFDNIIIKSAAKGAVREREPHPVLLAEFGFLCCGSKASKRLFSLIIKYFHGGNMINFWG
jgi:hypothetical protein